MINNMVCPMRFGTEELVNNEVVMATCIGANCAWGLHDNGVTRCAITKLAQEAQYINSTYQESEYIRRQK